MEIDIKKIEPFLSQYLLDGWKQDKLVLKSVQISPGIITGKLDVVEHFMPGDGVFHFTAPLAFIWIAQLAIVYTCWEHELETKPGEVYLREIQLETRKMINKLDDIQVSLRVLKKRYIGPEQVYYIGEIDIENGSFVGIGKFICPLPATKESASAT